MTTKTKVELDVNDEITVRLTQKGFQIACDAGYQNIAVHASNDGYSSFRLYEFARIFGPHLYVGMPDILFELGRVYVTGAKV